MVMYDKYKTKGNKNWTRDKIEHQHIYLKDLSIGRFLAENKTSVEQSTHPQTALRK